MKEQANPTGRMLSYYGYATDRLKPLVTESDDAILLDRTIEVMKSIFDYYLDAMEEVLLGDDGSFDEVVVKDLTEKINGYGAERKRCLKEARRCSVLYFFTGVEGFKEASNSYRNCAKIYKESISTLDEVRQKSAARITKNNSEGKTLVDKLGDVKEKEAIEKNKFDNYLREFAVDISAEDRARYVAHPDHMVYDTILKLREKYDPTGRI